MQLEVGKIYEGKVTGITKFGAFVDLEKGKTGMVHISEVSTEYIEKVEDHLALNQIVKVKILNIDDKGKIALSIKQTQSKPNNKRFNNNNRGGSNFKNRKKEPANFEDMLNKFIQNSDERISDLKKVSLNKRGSRKGNGSNR